MVFKTNLDTLVADIGAAVKARVVYPTAPVIGESYAVTWNGTNWVWTVVPLPPPLSTFVPGWAEFPMSRIETVIATGTMHAAVNIGSTTPTIGAVTFERSSADIFDTNVPNPAGWSGTNWLIQQGGQAPVPPVIGNNTTRLEVTAFPDLPDPSFGSIAGVAAMATASIQRNHYITFSGLTIGADYYAIFIYATYPNSLTRATIIEPEGFADPITFGVDGIDSILSKGIKRFGFTATATSHAFLKSGPDNAGSYMNAALCIEG